jgi:twitching motility protein PilT
MRKTMNAEELLTLMASLGASDLILCPGTPPTYKVHLRFERPIPQILTPQDTEKLLEYLLTPDNVKSFHEKRQIDFAFSLGHDLRFRVNAYYQRETVSLVFRAIPPNPPLPDEIGLPSALVSLAEQPRGLILITGPTGSGKSTTLAALIEHLNQTRSLHIVTVEDPIEYFFTSKESVISQREVGRDVHSFPDALRVVLRQAPNVIVVGEMRDLETIRAALTAAETGHLVMGTLHTTSAAKTIDRIVDVFPEGEKPYIRSQFASTILGVFSQILLPRIGGGLALAYELMVVTPAIRTLIRDGKTEQIDNYISSGSQLGMTTLENTVRRLINGGEVAHQDAAPYLASERRAVESY